MTVASLSLDHGYSGLSRYAAMRYALTFARGPMMPLFHLFPGALPQAGIESCAFGAEREREAASLTKQLLSEIVLLGCFAFPPIRR